MMILVGRFPALILKKLRWALTIAWSSVIDSLRPSWTRISGRNRLLSPEMEAMVTAIEGAT